MRKIALAAAVAAALAATGAAVAHNVTSKGIKTVTTGFTAAPTTQTKTKSCTDATGDVWHITDGVYTGAATGDLAGNVTIRSHSVINTHSGLGYTQGKVILRDAKSQKELAEANLDAVNTSQGTLNGLLRGRTQDGMLLANFTATFNADGTQLSGTVGGTGTGANSAIVFGGLPKCAQSSVTPPKPILHAEGKVATASSASLQITVKQSSYTISVPFSLSAQVAALKQGDRVDVTAAQINGAYVLVSLRTHK